MRQQRTKNTILQHLFKDKTSNFLNISTSGMRNEIPSSGMRNEIPSSEMEKRPSLVRLHHICPRPIQSDSIVSNSMLSRDRVRFIYAKIESDQSLSRASQHSTLESFCITLVFTLSHKSSSDPLYDLDLEIEITLRRLRKARNIVVSNSDSSNSVSSSDNSSPVTNSSNFIEYSSTNNFAKLEQMENNDRTLKELATPDVVYQHWCIQYPQLDPAQSYELKFGLIHLLPKFHGLAREDPHKHLKEFHVVCSTMRLQGIQKDYIKMKTFSFSLDGAANDWLYLQPVLFNT
ncbi:hypothetical protein CR513_53393, partial [Mucuna pruriens]